jgi:hypothetical protein
MDTSATTESAASEDFKKQRRQALLASLSLAAIHALTILYFFDAIFYAVDTISEATDAVPYLVIAGCGYLTILVLGLVLPFWILGRLIEKYLFSWLWPMAVWILIYAPTAYFYAHQSMP